MTGVSDRRVRRLRGQRMRGRVHSRFHVYSLCSLCILSLLCRSAQYLSVALVVAGLNSLRLPRGVTNTMLPQACIPDQRAEERAEPIEKEKPLRRENEERVTVQNNQSTNEKSRCFLNRTST